MDSAYEYEFKCNTENKIVSMILKNNEIPTTCPNNIEHNIDTSSIVIINEISVIVMSKIISYFYCF